MGWPQPRPEMVEQALAWLRTLDPRISPSSASGALRNAGYDEPSIRAAVAMWQEEVDALVPVESDLRHRVAMTVVVMALGALAVSGIVLALPHVAASQMRQLDLGGVLFLLAILAVAIVPVVFPAWFLARQSRRLRRGSAVAALVFLVVPFLWVVGVAGLCVATTRGLGM